MNDINNAAPNIFPRLFANDSNVLFFYKNCDNLIIKIRDRAYFIRIVVSFITSFCYFLFKYIGLCPIFACMPIVGVISDTLLDNLRPKANFGS